jgi:3-oxoacyl-[acyl-carrier protein] reductase
MRGRKAIITGGARGIGAATALLFAEEGADIVVADRLPANETVAAIEALGRRAHTIETDVTISQDVRRMVEESIEALGHVDTLVNNAGVVHWDSVLETSEATWDSVIDVILKGTFLCIQTIYPHMRDRGYGKIVNVGSALGFVGGCLSHAKAPMKGARERSGPAFAAAKGGVVALTRWVAGAVAKDGIYVNAIAPGACDTEMTRGCDYSEETLPISRIGEPEEMAQAVLFLASDKSSYITGQVINVDGGWGIA